jgi:hypothetical protein
VGFELTTLAKIGTDCIKSVVIIDRHEISEIILKVVFSATYAYPYAFWDKTNVYSFSSRSLIY